MADKYLLDQVQSLQSQGGEVIVSFGGADATELAQVSPVTTVFYTSCLTMGTCLQHVGTFGSMDLVLPSLGTQSLTITI